MFLRINKAEGMAICHGQGIPIHYKEISMGNSTKTNEQFCGILKMDLQDK